MLPLLPSPPGVPHSMKKSDSLQDASCSVPPFYVWSCAKPMLNTWEAPCSGESHLSNTDSPHAGTVCGIACPPHAPSQVVAPPFDVRASLKIHESWKSLLGLAQAIVISLSCNARASPLLLPGWGWEIQCLTLADFASCRALNSESPGAELPSTVAQAGGWTRRLAADFIIGLLSKSWTAASLALLAPARTSPQQSLLSETLACIGAAAPPNASRANVIICQTISRVL
eukprot:1157870-Pelagomonas_calceolata.AAC.9